MNQLSRLILASLVLVLAAGWMELTPPEARASETTIWLVVDSDGDSTDGRLKIPLEWLATLDMKDEISLSVNGDKLRAKDLWNRYRALPEGSSKDIDRGIDDDGDPFVTHVVSEAHSRRKAEGRVHILSWDENGKKSDIRFPLDLGGLLSTVVQVAGAILGEHTKGSDIDAAVKDKGHLTQLADYGPFVLAEQEESDGSRIKVQIE